MLKIALTHDVDRIRKTYQFLTYTLKNIAKLNLSGFYYHASSIFKTNPYWCFPKIIEIENDYKIKSTFFFLDETIKFDILKISNWPLSLGRYRLEENIVSEIIKYLSNNGWEIGLHGSYNSFNDKNLMLKEKETLEKIIEKKVMGIRQHFLNIDDSTWQIQYENGFIYDSSFGHSSSVGFKKNNFSPFRPLKNEFVVYPMVIMDSPYMAVREKDKVLEKIFDETEENNGFLVVNWHQRSFNEKEFPGYLKEYINIIEKGIDRGAVFKTLGEYYLD